MDSWEDDIAEIARRRETALAMGGRERIERQLGRGKMTARDRIGLLLDPGTSLDEIGLLAEARVERTTMEGRRTPADGVITGIGRVNARDVLVAAEDFTVMGGSVGYVGMQKRHRIIELARRGRLPIVWLFDGAGARAHEWVRAGWAGGPHFAAMTELSGVVPMVAGVMGPCAGDPALMAAMCDFVVMVRGTSMLAVAGPPLVEPAIGVTVTPEELGGAELHTRASGVADNAVRNDRECLALIRRYLSYLPGNAWERPPRVAPADTTDPPADELLAIVPRASRQPYDMRRVVVLLVDRGSVTELKPDYARSLITSMARIGGDSVGIVANQPLHLGGAIDGPAADKLTHFIQLCDAFHLPLVFLTDVPGFMVGPESERSGTLRRGMRIAHALAQVSVPTVSVVIRKAYGMGAVAMCGHGGGQVLTLVWPSGEFGAMPVEGGVQAAHGSEMTTDDEREAMRQLYEQEGDPFMVAASFNFDDLVDPRETRGRITTWLRAVLDSPAPSPTPRSYGGIMP